MPISTAARDLIIEQEVTSEAAYKKKYRRPEWPGGGSGVTVGIGYDLGMADRAKITRDWQDHVDPAMLKVMASCAGVYGKEARPLAARVKSQILIEWDDAIQVFDDVDMPDWEAQVTRKIPKAADLNEDCLGVLVSLAYNRGAAGFTKDGDRYREMRAIRDAIQNGNLEDVPAELRSMKRLWPDSSGVGGLRARREAEAKLWERGMRKNGGMASDDAVDTTPTRLASGDDRADDDDADDTRSAAIGAGTAIVTPIAQKLMAKGEADPAGIAKVLTKAAEPMRKSKSMWASIIAMISGFFGFGGLDPDAGFLEKAKAFLTSPGFFVVIMFVMLGLIIYWRWKDHGPGALKS